MTFSRSLAVLAAALLALSLPAALAAPGPVPGAGTLRQGETDLHHYDNNPTKGDCVQMATTYTVTLTYAPAGDVLTLSAGGKTATGSGGAASVSFQAGVCTSFDVRVTGTQVADTAAYAVSVQSGLLGGSVLAWG